MAASNWEWSLDAGRTVSWVEHLSTGESAAESAGARLAACIDDDVRPLVGSAQTLARSMTTGGHHSSDATKIPPLFSWGQANQMAALVGAASTSDSRRSQNGVIATAFDHFEIARDAFRRGFQEESLASLSAAIDGRPGLSAGYRLEWRFYFLRGIVRLGAFGLDSFEHVAPALAESDFRAAARLASADAPVEAARAWLCAGWAAFVQSVEDSAALGRALSHTHLACHDASLTEALFQMAKFQMAAKAHAEAAEWLRKASAVDPAYLVRAVGDGDFKHDARSLRGLIAALRDERLRQVSDVVAPLIVKLRPLLSESPHLANNPTVRRVVAYADGQDAGLLDLVDYAAHGLARDRLDLKLVRAGLVRHVCDEWDETTVQRVPTGEVRKVATGKVERIPTGETETYEVTIEEEYDDVVEKPGWLGRGKEVVKKTRPVTVTRTRPVMVERPVMVDAQVVRQVKRTIRKKGPARRRVFICDGYGNILRELPCVVVRPGRFLMGAKEDWPEVTAAEQPRHEVQISHALEVWSTPVTQSQYRSVMNSNPSACEGPERPVDSVTWLDAIHFCNMLSRSMDLPEAYGVVGHEVTWSGPSAPGWRLLTEAEWEYCCRAGADEPAYGPANEIGWHQQSPSTESQPVARKAPNGWGLFDMLGNVWEWVWDWRADYDAASAVDPTGPSEGTDRVRRGSSWSNAAGTLRASIRFESKPNAQLNNVGFRVCRTVPVEELPPLEELPAAAPPEAAVTEHAPSAPASTETKGDAVSREGGGEATEPHATAVRDDAATTAMPSAAVSPPHPEAAAPPPPPPDDDEEGDAGEG